MKAKELAKQLKSNEKLTKRFGKLSISVGSDFPPVQRVPTGLYALDCAIGGGVPVGSVTLIEGRYATSKSAICYRIAGNAVKQLKLPAAIIHSEMYFDYSTEWATACGLPLNDTLVFNEGRMEPALDLALELIRSGEISCLIIDSLASLKPSEGIDNISETQGYGMQKAKTLNAFFNKLGANIPDDNKPVILATQHLYMSPGMQYTSYKRSGGEGQGFISGLILRMSKGEIGEAKIASSSGEDTTPVWALIKWKIEKNKFGPEGATGSFRLYMQDAEFPLGTFSEAPMALTMALHCGSVEKKGAWYVYNGEKYQGETKILKVLDCEAVFAAYDAWKKGKMGELSDATV